MWTPGSGSRALNHSLTQNHEEAIQWTFDSGKTYTLRFNFFKAWVGLYEADDCETILFEAQIIPVDTVNSRLNALSSDTTNVPILLFNIPPANPQLGFIYDSSHPDNQSAASNKPLRINTNSDWDYNRQTIINSWMIRLPSQISQAWDFEASIGAEFIFGGSLALVVIPGIIEKDQIPNNLPCINTGNCTLGYRRRMNEHTVSVTLAAGGEYTLALFDRKGQRSPVTSGKAVPFSMTVSLLPSKTAGTAGVTCNAPLLPDVLPGYFEEPKGWFHFNERVYVNLSTPTNKVYIQVKEKSYFRVHVLAHRIDVDLRLFNSSHRELASELAFGSKEEAIAAVLDQGNYELNIIYYGYYQTKPCETMSIEIALEPISVSSGANALTCPTNVLPPTNLGTFPQANGQPYVMRGGPYVWDSQNVWAKKDIHTIAFTVTKEIHFKATLGFSFVLYDLNLKLTTGTTNGTVLGEPTRNHESVSLVLPVGNYSLVIGTSHAGTSLNPLVLPRCAEFDLVVEVYNITSPTYQYNLLPTDLRLPGYLGRGDFLHFAEEVLLPITNTGSWTAVTSMRFNVTKESMFRVWAEPHDIDIDFELRENGLVVATNLNIGTEETIMRTLTSGKQYELRTHYYRFSTPGASHRGWHTANMELAIAPTGSLPPIGPVSVPPRNYIPDFEASKCKNGELT